MKTRIILLVVLAAIAAGGYYAYRHLNVRRESRSDQILVSGNVETTEVQVAFKIPGRVIERLFDEGAMVRRGEKVAVLESADLRGTIALRKAELHTAQFALDELLAGSRVEDIAAAKAAWERASHTLTDLEAGRRRITCALEQVAARGDSISSRA